MLRICFEENTLLCKNNTFLTEKLSFLVKFVQTVNSKRIDIRTFDAEHARLFRPKLELPKPNQNEVKGKSCQARSGSE